jgi:ketosteroid isomerase-like protein
MSLNKETVQRYMDAYSRWDHEDVLACLTDDVEWVVPGAFHLVGREAFDKEIEGQGAAGPPEIVVSRLIEEHEVVVAEGTVRSALHDGGVLSLAFCDVFWMRDGLIRRLTSYLMAVPDLPFPGKEHRSDGPSLLGCEQGTPDLVMIRYQMGRQSLTDLVWDGGPVAAPALRGRTIA